MKELQVLGYCLNNPEWLSKIQPEIFKPEERLIFRQALDIHVKGLKPTKESLLYMVPQLETLINDTYNQEYIDDTVFYLIKEEMRLKAISEYTNEMALLHIQQPDYKTLKENAVNLNRLMTDEVPVTLGLGDDFFDLDKHIQVEGTLLKSGLRFLADTGSEPEKGQLMTFMAPSNNGKSTVMGNMCRKMFATGYNVIYFAFEETTSDFMTRIARGLLKKTQYQYQNYSKDELQGMWDGASDKLGKLTVVTGVAVDAESIQDVIKENEDKYGISYDCVFIDYSSHISVLNSNKQAREDQVISKIFRKLKQIANTKDEEKLIVTAVQANRQGYQGTLGAQNAADSLGGIRESDLVLGIRLKTIQSPEVVKPEEDRPNRLQGVFEINTIKRRKGTLPVGSKFYYEFKADNNIYKIDNNDIIQRLELNWESMELSETYFEDVLNPISM